MLQTQGLEVQNSKLEARNCDPQILGVSEQVDRPHSVCSVRKRPERSEETNSKNEPLKRIQIIFNDFITYGIIFGTLEFGICFGFRHFVLRIFPGAEFGNRQQASRVDGVLPVNDNFLR